MKLYLIHPSSDKTSIFADVNYRKFRLRVSTNIIIKSSHWDQFKQKVTSANPDYAKINARLKLIRSNIDSYIAEIRVNKRAVNFIDFKYNINSIISPDNYLMLPDNQQNTTLLQHLDYYISKLEYLNNLKPSTIAHYNNLKRLLNDFTEYSVKKYYPENMNNKFYEDFTRFLRVQNDMVDNTVGGVIRSLKAFLNRIAKDGVNVNPDFREFKALKIAIPQTIALTEQEIEAIAGLELKSITLQKARDLFFVQLHTAQRRSDLFQLRKEHIDILQRKIKINQMKTGNPVVLPLTDKIIEIMEKYNYMLPKIEKKEYNTALKKLCRMAGIIEPTEIVRTQGSSRKVLVKPRCEFVSSHTIRRTAITILLRKGVMPEFVRKVAGIKSYDIFQKYIKLSQDEAADAIRNIWNDGDVVNI